MFNTYGRSFIPGNVYGNQTQGMVMQNIQHQPLKQAQCFFVGSVSDMENIRVDFNTLYIGVDQAGKKIYVKQMNNNGMPNLDEYALTGGKSRKNELQLINEKLDLLMGDLKNERNVSTDSTAIYDGAVSKSSDDGKIQSDDAEQKSSAAGSNAY